VAKDEAQAAIWYRKAADAGDADAVAALKREGV
jgi:TPR repeat protein